MKRDTWNPRSAGEWANLFGFVAVPMFGRGRKLDPGGRHSVLLDGRRSSLTFSQGDASTLLKPDRAFEWAWSSNIPRSIVVDERSRNIFAARWDEPGDVRKMSIGSPEEARQLLADLESPARPDEETSVAHALKVFRTVRQEVIDFGGDDVAATSTFAVLLALADLCRLGLSKKLRYMSEAVDALRPRHRFLNGYATPPQLEYLPIGDLANELLEQGPLYRLDPYLLIRHASGTLFQEAHVEIARQRPGSAKLFISIRDDVKPASGTLKSHAHYTPTSLARFLAEQALVLFRRNNPSVSSITILDPACGSGVFLVEALRELEGADLSTVVRGIDASPISTTMTQFTVESALDDFIAAGGTSELRVQQANSLSITWAKPDVILMNPPFHSWRQMTSDEREEVKGVLGGRYHGHADMGQAFLAKAMDELAPGGVLATVMPAGFLSSDASKPLRTAVASPDWQVSLVGRFKSYGYFDLAAVEPAFVIMSRATSGRAHSEVRTILADTAVADQAIREARTTPQAGVSVGPGWEIGLASLNLDDWTPRPTHGRAIIDEIRRMPRVDSLGNLFDVHLGIRTGSNQDFLIDAALLQGMEEAEQRHFRPVADIIRCGRIEESRYVFYPYQNGVLTITSEEQLESSVPVFYSEKLNPGRDRLRSRSSLRGRHWWELVEPRTSWLRMGTPRILTTSFGWQGSFAYDRYGYFVPVQGNAWIWKHSKPLPDVVWVAYLAILNSGIFESLLDYFCPQIGDGQFELAKRYLEQIPIPNLSIDFKTETGALLAVSRAIDSGEVVSRFDINDAVASAYGVHASTILRDMRLMPVAARQEAEFNRLASEWERGRSRGADLQELIEHPAYQRIIAMGDVAVPFILSRLKTTPAHWFPALFSITGANPVPEDAEGKIHGMAMAWVEWGKQKGYQF